MMNDKKRVVAFAMVVTLSVIIVLLWGKKVPASVGGETANPVQTTPSQFERKAQEFTIDQSTLDQIASGDKSEVEFSLFDGEVVRVSFNRREPIGDSGATVFGRIVGEPDSSVHMSIVENAMFGEIRLKEGRVFSIGLSPSGNGKFKLSEVNTSISMISRGEGGNGERTVHVNGQKIIEVECRSSNSASQNFTQIRMLGSEEWAPGLRILETLNEEEQFVADSQVPAPVLLAAVTRNPFSRNRPVVRGGVVSGTRRLVRPLNTVLLGAPSTTTKKQFRVRGRLPYGAGRIPLPGMAPQQQGLPQQMQQQSVQQQQQQGGGGNASTNQFSILIVYTPSVEPKIGGATGAKAKAASLVAAMNTSLNKCNIQETLVLVGTEKSSQNFDGYNGLSPSLRFIVSDTQINAWRDQYKADLVCQLIDDTTKGQAWGMAYMLPNTTTGGANSTQASSIWYSVPSTTFSHEVGHNLGCGHGGGNGGGRWPHSNGNHFTGNDGKGYRSIMAYNKTGFPTRVDVFSGPNVKYLGTTTGQAGATDNVKTVTDGTKIIKKYR